MNEPGWHSGQVLHPSPLPVRRTMPPVTTMPTSPTRLASRSGRTQRDGTAGRRPAARARRLAPVARSTWVTVGVEDTPQGYAAARGAPASPWTARDRPATPLTAVRPGRARPLGSRRGRPRRRSRPRRRPRARRACRRARSNACPRGDSSSGGRTNQSAPRVRTMKRRQNSLARSPHTTWVLSRSKSVVPARTARHAALQGLAALGRDEGRDAGDDGAGRGRPAQHAPPVGADDVGDGGQLPTGARARRRRG